MAPKRTLGIASDHAGFELKEYLKKTLATVEWVDEGPLNDDRTDYPDFAEKVGRKITSGTYHDAVLVCGSGIGMCIAANKFPSVRAAVVESEQTARLSREHNNANVLCLGARILKPEYAKTMVEAWLNTPFADGRHTGRIDKIRELEKKLNGKSEHSSKQ